ncbi:MAG: acyl-CoA dehydratase activase [Thermodesulfobacteriota bacterium]
MIVAGCDIGSMTAKAVIMENHRLLSSAVMRAKTKPAESAGQVMDRAIADAGISAADIAYTVGTGYGRTQIPFVDHVESEISCHAKGAGSVLPSVRTVIDIGGQDAKATRMDADGRVARYIYNDKCASGTGRFLEVMAGAMEIGLEQMGAIAAQSTEKLKISSQCVIFAETEVISLLNEGRASADIINALHHALANRIAALARTITVEPPVAMTGGVAKNQGVFAALSEALQLPLLAMEGIDPQLIGALGAALFAAERAGGAADIRLAK